LDLVKPKRIRNSVYVWARSLFTNFYDAENIACMHLPFDVTSPKTVPRLNRSSVGLETSDPGRRPVLTPDNTGSAILVCGDKRIRHNAQFSDLLNMFMSD